MTTAKDLMYCPPFTVSPEMPILEFARALDEKRLTGAAVVDREGKLVGVATESDLIDQHKRLHLPTVITLFDSVLSFDTHKTDSQLKKMLGATVADIMTSKLTTVEENATMEDIATIMAEEKKHLIPVVRGGKLVGLVDRSHVIHAIAGE
ncbi:MAG: CBS domain-containing protein [Nitrospinae bacterium]|nr:CBS domain-containing protein [Nitrospinota bacterium]